MEAVGILIKELMLALLDRRALDLLGGAVALGVLHAVRNAAHVDLGGRSALAGKEAFGAQDHVELAVDFKHITLTDRAGDDFHGTFLNDRVADPLGPKCRAAP